MVSGVRESVGLDVPEPFAAHLPRPRTRSIASELQVAQRSSAETAENACVYRIVHQKYFILLRISFVKEELQPLRDLGLYSAVYISIRYRTYSYI